eukprot:scaffold163561_cov64-Cyclotella_meneghiniana.AAC.1
MKYTSATLALLSAMASPASVSAPNNPTTERILEAVPICTLTLQSKIKIQSTTGEPLSMREVRVFSGSVNVAIGKTAIQSSDLNESSGPSKAVDGKWGTKAITGDSCSTWWRLTCKSLTLSTRSKL